MNGLSVFLTERGGSGVSEVGGEASCLQRHWGNATIGAVTWQLSMLNSIQRVDDVPIPACYPKCTLDLQLLGYCTQALTSMGG